MTTTRPGRTPSRIPTRILAIAGSDSSGGAFICSFECTFCAECAEDPDDRCLNCGGGLMDRPTRAKALHAKYPPSTQRRFKGQTSAAQRTMPARQTGRDPAPACGDYCGGRRAMP